MKILISGITGFIGKNLYKRLSKTIEVVAIVRPSTDLSFLVDSHIPYYIYGGDMADLVKYISSEKIEGVIHLASLFLPKHSPSDVDKLVSSNVLFPSILLEAANCAGVTWFINTGTFWQHYKDKKYSPVNLYAATKQAFEDVARYYFETSKINFVTIKLCDTFGPDDTRPKIVNLWNKISKTGEVLDMSPGNQIIDINYVDNVVDGYLTLIDLLKSDKKRKLNGKTFAIKANKRMTLRSLAKLFERTAKVKLNINWGRREYREREVMMPWTKGQTIPGWRQKVSIQEGILRTINEKK